MDRQRGALSLAHTTGVEQGRREGREDGLRQRLRLALEDAGEAPSMAPGAEQQAALDADGLEARRLRLKRERRRDGTGANRALPSLVNRLDRPILDRAAHARVH